MYRIHTVETAPEASRPALEAARRSYGFLAILALEALSNYANHVAETPLDPGFEPRRWEKQGEPVAAGAGAPATGGAR